jgi:hypothetical protein
MKISVSVFIARVRTSTSAGDGNPHRQPSGSRPRIVHQPFINFVRVGSLEELDALRAQARG